MILTFVLFLLPSIVTFTLATWDATPNEPNGRHRQPCNG